MKSIRLHYTSQFKRPAAEVWPALADTNRLNAVEGTFEPYTVIEVLQPDGSVRRQARGRLGPLPVKWEEEFGEWIENRYMRQVRYFSKGPVRKLELEVQVSEDDGKTRFQYEFVASWDSLLGNLINSLGVHRKITAKLVRGIEARAQALIEPADTNTARKPPPLRPAARKRLQACIDEIERGPFAYGLVQQLADFLTGAEAIDLKKIRPLALARTWAVSANAVIELCVAAQRSGLLTMRWDILCPRCRGGKAQADNLYELPRGVHCDSCNIDYERDFARNVELVFSVAPWLRKLPEGEFCMLGAASTPHVKVQLKVLAQSVVRQQVSFMLGRYRLRTVEAGEACEIDCDGRSFPEVIVDGQHVEAGPLAEPGQMVLRNQGDRTRTFVIEEYAWTSDALIGPRVIALPAFRELCPEQVLRPGDDVAVGRITVMFTDLKESTALYTAIGDSAAYSLVRDHFIFLADRVRSHRGVLVKTIGDSVMAAFEDPADALRAAFAVQRDVADFNAEHESANILIKLGIHQGESIAVTTGGILDYFGTTVNIAARLEEQSRGGDIVLSAAMLDDPAVAELLKEQDLQAETVTFDGFAESITLYRINSGCFS